MKKVLAASLITLLCFSTSTAAIANSSKTMKVGNQITVTFPKTVKLKGSGCQNVPISYKVGKMSGFDFAYAAILDDEDNLIGGKIIYRTPTYAKDAGYKVSKKSAKVNIKICRGDWSEDIGDGDYEDYVGASKGEFQFYVTTSEIDNIDYIKFN